MEKEGSNFIITNHKKISNEIPKAELHIHNVGCLEPEFVVELNKRNGLNKFNSVEELRKRFEFENLDGFLNVIADCTSVIQTKQDFEDLTFNYLRKALSQGVIYSEIFFAPQFFLNRLSLKDILEGQWNGIAKANKELQVNAEIILCFNRGLSEESAISLLKETQEILDNLHNSEIKEDREKNIIGIGLVASEYTNPPEKFKDCYKLAKEMGFKLVAHCCEEKKVPLDHFYQALDILKVDRIDHGTHCYKDECLLDRLVNENISLTLCPFSHVKLKVFNKIEEFKEPLSTFNQKGVIYSINSDDPSFFGGYIADNYEAIGKLMNFSLNDYKKLAINSFQSSFLPKEKKEFYIKKVNEYIGNFKE